MLALWRAGHIELPAVRRRPPNPLSVRARPQPVELDRTPLSGSLRDLAPLTFDRMTSSVASIGLSRTESGHIASSDATSNGFAASRTGTYEVRPTGNAVNLEDEMIKVAANQMDYQAATTLYTRSLNLIKTAIGKR